MILKPLLASSYLTYHPFFSLRALITWTLLLVPVTAQWATAQLISPGKLSLPHDGLSGITNCTQCHTLGQRSIDKNLCLDCHVPLQNRIEDQTGYHATVADQNCASCHKEHFGEDFDMVRLDTLRFDHDETGFLLTGAHVEANCSGCHQPANIVATDVLNFKGRNNALDNTYLGVASLCLDCHQPDNPHQGQFEGQNCENCHATKTWEEVPAFNHDNSRFPLTGEHLIVECSGCHTEVRGRAGEPFIQYEPLNFANCNACHTDPHDNSFGSDCASCHQTEGWNRVSASVTAEFDHESTGFPLIGSHSRTECASCHAKPARRDDEFRLAFVPGTQNNVFPRVVADNCISCHVDYHSREFLDAPGGAVCSNCHSEHDWYPVDYDIQRHNQEASFALTGSHRAIACVNCHLQENGQLLFSIPETECQDCHESDNPHGKQFVASSGETTCATCHNTADWLAASSDFDHFSTEFPLLGKHAITECNDCHEVVTPTGINQVFTGLDTSCLSCHRMDDPHQDQFSGTDCGTCHNENAFTMISFDHTISRFPLEGAHADVACADCHKQESSPENVFFTRFKPIGVECENCHGEE